MKVEFVFHNKGNKFDVTEIQSYLNNIIAKLAMTCEGKAFTGQVESVTQMSRWLVILIDCPTLTKHGRSFIDRTENWWEALAGYMVLKYDVVFLNWEVHGEGQSLLFK